MQPGEHAAAIIAHYIRIIAERHQLRWTAANDADFDLLGELLDTSAAEDGDTIPPFARPVVSDRVTQEFERNGDYGDPEFERWRLEKAEAERYNQARRMMRRGGDER